MEPVTPEDLALLQLGAHAEEVSRQVLEFDESPAATAYAYALKLLIAGHDQGTIVKETLALYDDLAEAIATEIRRRIENLPPYDEWLREHGTVEVQP